jgi:hypothetical protein
VPFIGQSTPNTFQMHFLPNGTVHVVWQQIQSSTFALLAGWSAGGTQLDPGSRDLSSTLSTPLSLCAQPVNGMTLNASALPLLGSTLQWQVAGVPAGTGFGAMMRSLAQAVPPIDLTSVGMPGCFSHLQAPVGSLFLSPTAAFTINESIPSNTALAGMTLVGQVVAYSPPLTPLGLIASNGMVLTLGL